jgi:hypothetical protein
VSVPVIELPAGSASVVAPYVYSDAVAPGFTPALPYEERRRKLESSASAEEALLRDEPRHGRLRVQRVPVVHAERAVLVAAHGERDEEPLAERELLLQVVAERLHRRREARCRRS